jgi:hypothetical protein
MEGYSSGMQKIAISDGFYDGNKEPTLLELLNDWIMTLLMASDGIRVADVLRVVDQAKAALRTWDRKRVHRFPGGITNQWW